MSNKDSTGFKLKLKKDIIGYNGKPIFNSSEMPDLHNKYPKLTPDQLLEKCSTFILGDQLASILMQVAGNEEVTKDPTEKLKLFRYATKIVGKLETDKGELEIDLKQAEELFKYVGKVKQINVLIIAPILGLLDDIISDLSKTDLK